MSKNGPDERDVDRPAVGVAVFVLRGDTVLLGRRRSRRGLGQWSTPGGHLEPGEDFEDCAIREAQEEAAIEITNAKLVTVTNDIIRGTGEHFVTVVMVADYAGGRARVLERGSFFRWGWFDWRQPPQPLSAYVSTLWNQNFDPFAYATQPRLPIQFPKLLSSNIALEFPDENQSARDWLLANGYSHVARMIDEITQEWRANGKVINRNWWAILAGDSAGRPRNVAGRVFPILPIAQLRQGWFAYRARRS